MNLHLTAGENEALFEQWDNLQRSSWAGIRGSDATYSSPWVKAMQDTLLRGHTIDILTVGSIERITALLPFTRSIDRNIIPGIRKLSVTTEAYSGRSSFLVEDNSVETGQILLESLASELKDWDTLQLTVVERSIAHVAIHKQANNGQLYARCIGSVESPYIELGATWDDTFDSLPKKLRWTIRKSEKDLAALGNLTYEEHTDSTSIDTLFQAIYEIEQQSWKEDAGSSITTQQQQKEFYEALAKYATRAGTFSAHLLRLDGKPLAYILGLAAGDGVFLDLKESFVQSHAKYSPAHVLKRFAFTTLIAKGVRLYDFMGVCEPYKMRWTDKTYKRHTFILFNKTWRGRLLYLKSQLSKTSQPIPASSA